MHKSGGTVLNTFKGVGQKRGEGKQKFKKRGKLGQGVSALKRKGGGGEGLEPPYELWVVI